MQPRTSSSELREVRSLNGTWWCTPDPEDQGRRLGFHQPEYDYLDLAWRYGSRMWRQVTVPCTYTNCGPDMRRWVGVAWFRREFTVPKAWRRKRVVVRFEALNFVSRIWINGQHVKTHPDGLLRFEVPLDEVLRYGESNTIILSTDNRPRFDDRSPGMDTGIYLGGGIAGNAMLIATDPAHIECARFAYAEPDGDQGRFALRVQAANGRKAAVRAKVGVVIRDSRGRQCGKFEEDVGSLEPSRTRQVTIKREMRKVKAWSPDHPNLYTAEVTLRARGREVDTVTERFGFRKIEARDEQLYLNGEPLYLRGINYHDDTGSYPADTFQEAELAWHEPSLARDLKLIKGLGVNFVRLPHMPRIAPKLDLFDEMGLMVLEENNLHWWQQDLRTHSPWHTFKPTKAHIQSIARATHRQLRKMILRDMNHPCVICWSMSNECRPENPGILDTIRESLRIAKRLDPSRLSVHVSAEWNSDYGEDDFSLDDMIACNGYKRDPDWWERELAQLRERYPGKPIISSEVGNSAADDDAQALIVGRLLSWLGDSPFLSGVTVYDFGAVPGLELNREGGAVSGAYHERRVIRQPKKNLHGYGIFTRDRRPRKAAKVVERFMNKKKRK